MSGGQPRAVGRTPWPADWWHEPFADPAMVLSPGPERVDYSPDPAYVARPVGFLARTPAPPSEPLLWEGDQA